MAWKALGWLGISCGISHLVQSYVSLYGYGITRNVTLHEGFHVRFHVGFLVFSTCALPVLTTLTIMFNLIVLLANMIRTVKWVERVFNFMVPWRSMSEWFIQSIVFKTCMKFCRLEWLVKIRNYYNWKCQGHLTHGHWDQKWNKSISF